MPFKDMPIRRKLMAIILLISLVVMLLMRGAFFTYEYLSFRQETVRQLSTIGRITAANSTAALAFSNQDDAAQLLTALKAEQHIVAACLYDRAGNLFAKYPANFPNKNFPASPEPAAYRFEQSFLIGFQPVAEGGRRLGTLYLKFDTAPIMQEWLRVSASIGAGILAVIGMVAFLLSRTLQKQISHPILELAKTAEAISVNRDYSVRTEKLAGGELGVLTDAFNHMLAQIEARNQAVIESEARVRAVLNSALSAVLVIDAKGRVVDWNPRAEKIFGWTRREALGLELAKTIIPPRYREAHRRGMKRFLATGEGPLMNQLIEMSALRRDGSEFPVELSISALIADNTVTFCGFVTDITARKQAEETLLKKANELARSNNDLEQFAYIASHDLQEPLRAVAGCLQILQKRYQNQLDAGADELIDLAVDGAQRLQSLIEGLLSFSRVSTRGKELQLVDCEKAVQGALKNLSVAIEESGATVTHDVLPEVMGDLLQLTQLFQNLIGNAVKFRRKEEPPSIHVGAENNGTLCKLSVRDNGIGIDPQYNERIFEIFQRLHTRQEYPGTGIGLALCRKIVERHGGKIWLESAPQQGSTFYFYLMKNATSE